MVEIPKEIEEYGFKIEQKPSDVDKTVNNNLCILKEQSSKLSDCYEMYCTSNNERLRDELLEAMNSRINHISQAFRDIMAFIEITEESSVYEESLRYYVRQYLSRDISKSANAVKAAEFLTKRNDLVHDYFNINARNQELVRAMANYGNGFYSMAESLKEYCHDNFPELELEQDLKKALQKKSTQDR